MASGVSSFVGGPLAPFSNHVGWIARGQNQSLILDVRPLWQAGHQGHPQHKVRVEVIEVERVSATPSGHALDGWLTWYRVVGTGTHPTDWQMLINWQTI